MGAGHLGYYIDLYSEKAWGFMDILLPRGRMNFLTLRPLAVMDEFLEGTALNVCLWWNNLVQYASQISGQEWFH